MLVTIMIETDSVPELIIFLDSFVKTAIKFGGIPEESLGRPVLVSPSGKTKILVRIEKEGSVWPS